MDGIHDMGGMHGFGPIPRQSDYVFRADWQRRAFGLTMTLLAMTPYGADAHRRALERIPADDYLRRDYFDKWTLATSALALEAGLVSREELADGRPRMPVSPGDPVPPGADELLQAMQAGAALMFPDDPQPARFKVGARVRVKNDHPAGHTRSPRYLRGHVGLVTRDVGVMQFADSMAAAEDPAPQHCYTLAFEGRDLWGRDAEPGTKVYADLWEAYLEPV